MIRLLKFSEVLRQLWCSNEVVRQVTGKLKVSIVLHGTGCGCYNVVGAITVSSILSIACTRVEGSKM